MSSSSSSSKRPCTACEILGRLTCMATGDEKLGKFVIAHRVYGACNDVQKLLHEEALNTHLAQMPPIQQPPPLLAAQMTAGQQETMVHEQEQQQQQPPPEMVGATAAASP